MALLRVEEANRWFDDVSARGEVNARKVVGTSSLSSVTIVVRV